jgi:GntR family transcriptional regulator/MocR family aminotransferase
MVVAPDLLEAVGDAKMLADSGSPQLDQLALARFIEHGELDRHLRRMRGSFRRRRDLMIATLADELGELEVEGIPAGLHVCGRLPAEVALGPLLAAAWERSIGIYGFQHGDVARVLLGYANLPEPSVQQAVRELAELVRAGS